MRGWPSGWGDADETLRLSGWNVDFTLILSLWTSMEDRGCLANWRGGAMLELRQPPGRRASSDPTTLRSYLLSLPLSIIFPSSIMIWPSCNWPSFPSFIIILPFIMTFVPLDKVVSRSIRPISFPSCSLHHLAILHHHAILLGGHNGGGKERHGQEEPDNCECDVSIIHHGLTKPPLI